MIAQGVVLLLLLFSCSFSYHCDYDYDGHYWECMAEKMTYFVLNTLLMVDLFSAFFFFNLKLFQHWV